MIGLIAEGKTDVVVIKQILAAHLKIDTNEIRSFRPDDFIDETDKFSQGVNTFSNWTIVKEECQKKEVMKVFFDDIADSSFFIIHIDADRAFEEGYNGSKPQKSKDPAYCQELREAVYCRIHVWLGPHTMKIAYAIAVEETEAWILPMHSNVTNSDLISDPKRALRGSAAYSKLRGKKEPVKYLELSKPIKKYKNMLLCQKASYSLTEFLAEVDEQLID